MEFDGEQWHTFGDDLNDLDLRTPGLEDDVVPVSRSSPPSSGYALPLLQASEWDEQATYNENPPSCVHYDLTWKISLNKGTTRLTNLTESRTENNLVLAPGAFWKRTLKDTVQQVLERKTPAGKKYTIEETKIKVSTDQRGRSNLFSKVYDLMDILWDDVERELEKASDVLLSDKRILVDITVVYKDATPTGAGPGRGAGRRQRAAHDLLVNGNGDHSPQSEPLWKRVYRLFRCALTSCGSNYCWDDPVDQKHYPLDTAVLEKLLEHAKTNTLETFDQVPQDIRNIIRARDQGSPKKRKISPSDQTPIHVHYNHVPSDIESNALQPMKLNIPGPRDEAVHLYCEWSCTQVRNTRWREQLRQAFAIMEEGYIDLHYAHESQDEVIQFLESKKVQRSIAMQIVRHVITWQRERQAQGQGHTETGGRDAA